MQVCTFVSTLSTYSPFMFPALIWQARECINSGIDYWNGGMILLKFFAFNSSLLISGRIIAMHIIAF